MAAIPATMFDDDLEQLAMTRLRFQRIFFMVFAAVAGLTSLAPVFAEKLPYVDKGDAQPLLQQVSRLVDALDYLGQPLSDNVKAKLKQAEKTTNDDEARRLVQEALDPLALFGVHINPESRVKVVQGTARPELVELGWSHYLVKVYNHAGVTAPLRVTSPNAGRNAGATADKQRRLWLEMTTFDQRPLTKTLSGVPLEYRIVQMLSRDPGKRTAVIAFDVGQGTQDLGFRNDVTITFDCQPAIPVQLQVRDENNQPTMAGFVIRDVRGRVYPSPNKRLAPDFSFHPQVYRHDGEKIKLPRGKYVVVVTRGPEYLPVKMGYTVGQEDNPTLDVKLERWIDPSQFGWWSGDHHIHAAGCAHYTNPTEGVLAKDMMRHCLGEDLKVGCNLTWGPCFDFQKQFFTGKIDRQSTYPYLLRYDIEVSGFGSHRSGHLCLLRLEQQIYPGGESKHHWPTLCLNTLRWAKKQGAICGPAHSGWGLQLPDAKLPNYALPPYDGIGANEYIVDVTHMVDGPNNTKVPAVDFLSMVDTPYVWELNMWYHTLNCGYRTRISGETDFPCIYGERVGLGRSYVKLGGELDFDRWCEGIQQGAAYVSDGRSHLLDLQVNDAKMGVGNSELSLARPGQVKVKARVAARLPETADPVIRKRPYTSKPYWHLERARLGDSRQVNVELIVNGQAVASKPIQADGRITDIEFDTKLEHSSWVALRILPSSHTNPVFIVVDNKPIRASRRSAQWCLDGVIRCREQKKRFIDADEIEDFNDAYQHAREQYQRILNDSVAE